MRHGWQERIRRRGLGMQLGTTILAIMLSFLFAFNISAGERDVKNTSKNPLKKHTKIEGLDAVELNGKAEILCKNGKYHEAIKILNKALHVDSEYATAYYNRGWAYFQTKQYYKSIEDFDRAMGLEPKYLFAYDIPDWAYFKLKQYTRAIEDYDKAIALNPKNASYYRFRGSYYSKLKQDTKAIPDFDKAIELNPTQGGAYAWRGLAHIRIGRAKQGCADLKKACNLGECRMLEGALENGFCLDITK